MRRAIRWEVTEYPRGLDQYLLPRVLTLVFVHSLMMRGILFLIVRILKPGLLRIGFKKRNGSVFAKPFQGFRSLSSSTRFGLPTASITSRFANQLQIKKIKSSASVTGIEDSSFVTDGHSVNITIQSRTSEY